MLRGYRIKWIECAFGHSYMVHKRMSRTISSRVADGMKSGEYGAHAHESSFWVGTANTMPSTRKSEGHAVLGCGGAARV